MTIARETSRRRRRETSFPPHLLGNLVEGLVQHEAQLVDVTLEPLDLVVHSLLLGIQILSEITSQAHADVKMRSPGGSCCLCGWSGSVLPSTNRHGIPCRGTCDPTSSCARLSSNHLGRKEPVLLEGLGAREGWTTSSSMS